MEVTALVTRALRTPAPESSGTDQRILDGALEEVAAAGTGAATMTGVARRAGVGRVTVFRRFGSKEALMERLVLRELRRFLDEVESLIDPGQTPGERIAALFVACLRAGREHPLVSRLVRLEPAVAMRRLAAGSPSPLDVGREFVAARIRADEPALAGRADAVADALVRLTASYVLFPPAHLDLTDDEQARAFARDVLGRLVSP